ncbi:DUF6105 family protein [Aquamicrobium sp. LC103]|uniref:DUF6105 family protein n=1 Tax=Aquamicrobium sp. LC103 TaxID=1120658 RepID=UPI00063E8089|nr:DUF6105 family protein [Aquamicrobium sp. LC103]TKT76835.1 hypothetical protein XW59_015350 [Aquamicrobium sp. LC103]
MRYILIFWAVPMGLFWGWYYLSYHDINFGFLFLSRLVHDFAFETYGNLLGIEPSTIPPLVARACVIDTALIFGIFAFRRRREIMRWVSETRQAMAERSRHAAPEAGRAPPAE